MIGREISHYRVLERLGAGGMGEVFKAEDLRLGRPVALKFLSPELGEDPVAKERFIQEARAASALNHDNVCTIYDIDEREDGRLFLAMAFYDGETLDKRLAAGPLPVDTALDLAQQVAEGLSRAHGKGITHRDIKPANLMVTRDGVVKILDFGLAKLTEGPGLTKTGTSMGTPAYMSPEQARGEEIDHRTDLWSLGVVLYEMLFGRRLFRGQSNAQILHAVLYDAVPDPGSKWVEVPDEIRRLLSSLLTREPEQRCPTALQALELIRSARERASREAEAPTLAWSGEPAADRDGSRKKAGGLVATLVAAALAIGALGTWWLGTGNRSHDSSTPVRDTLPGHAPTVAVLPFTSLSSDEENAYFADGIHEDILTHLSRVEGLTVLARTSVLRYRDTERAVREIADEIGADAILEGSVRRAGEQVRINAQLIDGDTETHLWAQTYDRRLDDIFAVQTEIARSVAGSLEATLSPAQEERMADRPTESLAAYDLYLKGREVYHRDSEDNKQEAIRLFRKALDLDPEYALAWAGLADAFTQWASYYGDTEKWSSSAVEAAGRALALDPMLVEGHTALGNAYHVLGRKRDALEAYLRAIEIAPDHWDALSGAAVVYYGEGRFDEAIHLLLRAARLAPNQLQPRYLLAHTYKFLSLDEASKEWMETILVLEPDHIGARLLRPQYAMYEGDFERVVALCEEIVRDTPDDPWALTGAAGLAYGSRAFDRATDWARRSLEIAPERTTWYFHPTRVLLGVSLLRIGERGEGVKLLREAIARQTRMVELGKEEDYEPFWHLAAAHAALGEHDAALLYFERAFEAGFRFPRWPPVDPAFDGLRESRRYRDIMRRIDEHATAMRKRVVRRERAAGMRAPPA